MKKKIFTLLLLSVFTGLKVSASHFIGGEISYAKVAPNIYAVTFKSYQDCNAPVTQAVLVSYKSPGCNTGGSATLTNLGTQLAQIYGPNTAITCSPTVFNYNIVTYAGVVTLSQSQLICNDWILSVTEGSRADAANAVQAATSNLYTEALLKVNSGSNNSPVFDAINPIIPVVPFNQPVLLSMSASDADGDSLSYELVSALTAANTSVQYAANTHTSGLLPQSASAPYLDPVTGNCMVYNNGVEPQCLAFFKTGPNDPRPLPYQTAILPAGFCSGGMSNTTFSASYPLPSYLPNNWKTCQTNISFGPYFILDPRSGSLEFNPTYYNANANPTNPDNNHYYVSVLVKEWRRTGNQIHLLGSVRRETMIIVGSFSPNVSPKLAAPAGGLQKAFVVAPGTTLNYTFQTTDSNPSDLVTMTSDATSKLPGAMFTTTGAQLPTGTLTWTPTISQARTLPYYFNIVLKDNGSLSGYTVETIKVEVRNAGVSGIKTELQNTVALAAFPNPFSEEVSFMLNAKEKLNGQLVIYNILGREIDRIELKNLPAGEQTVAWKNAATTAPGSYVARLISGQNQSQSIKFLKLK